LNEFFHSPLAVLIVGIRGIFQLFYKLLQQGLVLCEQRCEFPKFLMRHAERIALIGNDNAAVFGTLQGLSWMPVETACALSVKRPHYRHD
jgi:hypothetical protein